MKFSILAFVALLATSINAAAIASPEPQQAEPGGSCKPGTYKCDIGQDHNLNIVVSEIPRLCI